MEINNRIRGLGLGIAIVSGFTLLAFIFIESRSINLKIHAQTLHNLTEIRALDARVDRELLRVRTGTVLHLDSLVAATASLGNATRLFNNNIPEDIAQEIQPEWRTLRDKLAIKRILIEDFKFESAILRNSLNYLPKIVKQLSAEDVSPEFMNRSYEILNHLLRHHLTLADDQARSAQYNLDLLDTDPYRLSPNAETLKQNFILHSKLVLKRNRQVVSVLNSATNTPVTKAAKALERHYIEVFSAHQEKRDQYRTLLFILAALMGVAVVYTYIRLRLKSRALKNLVHELEFQKFALDQHALVSITNVRGDITYANNKFCELSGYTLDELIGKNHNIIKSQEHPLSMFRDMWRDIAHGKVWHGEIHNHKKNGESYWVHSTIVPFLDEHKKPFQYISIRTDITHRKRMEADLVQANVEAEQANQAKSDFLANMSHEIRTPMNAIIGMSHLALQTDLDLRQQGYIENVSNAAESLLGIINDILDFSKIEAGKLDLEYIDFQLGDVMDNLANLVGLKSAEKGLELLFDIDRNIPETLIGDPLRLGQILINLANNAVKFTDTGEVVVSARLLPNHTNGDSCLEFSVRDSGIGMTIEQQGKLFKSFSQADNSTTRRFGGTGLGLAISKQLVEAMKGEISAQSHPGQGSVFKFTAVFGTQTASHPKMTRRRPAPQGRLEGLQVLVTDDNSTSRVIFDSLLQSFDYQVDTAHSGQQALVKCLDAQQQGHPYDLIIMDWRMPVMDGLQTIQALQSQMGKTLPPILMATAYGRGDLLSKAENTPIQAVITKPISASSLFEAVQEAMGELPDSNIRRHGKTHLVDAAVEELKGAEILLVEDNPLNQELALELLSRNGLIPSLAENGQEALDMLKKRSFDGILMDAQMPVMDGYTATRKIREQARYKDLPIIAMTANAMAGDREKCLEAGMNDHIPKPVNVRQMMAIMATWITPSNHPSSHSKDNEQSSLDKQPAATQALPELNTLKNIDLEFGLNMVAGDETLYRKLLGIFYQTETDFNDRFQGSMDANDMETATRHAHTLKGVCANIGAKGVNIAAAALEDACRNDPGSIPKKLIATREELVPVLESVKKLLGQ